MYRSLFLVFLAACATGAPTYGDAPLPGPAVDRPADAPLAPPGPLTVTLGALVPDAVATITIDGLDPGEDGHVASSRWGVGAGPCFPAIGGLCLDLVGPVYHVGSATADAGGTASIDVYLPSHLDGVELCFEGIAHRHDSPSVKGTAVCAVVGDDGGGPVCVPEDEIWGDGLDQDCDGRDQEWEAWQAAWVATCGKEVDGPWHCVGIPAHVGALDLSDAVEVEFAYGMACKIDLAGDGHCAGSYAVDEVLFNEGPWVDIGAGLQSTVACFLDPDGEVGCFGDDRGDGRLSPPPGPFTSVDTGQYHACGQHPDGTLSCWGASGGHWQDYDQVDATPGTVFGHYATGQRFNCGVDLAGALECWGRNDEGQADPPAGEFTKVAAGNYHACALATDGTIACWGTDNWIDLPFESPVADDFVDVFSGPDHACGVHADGWVDCWGNNQAGETTPPFHEDWTTLAGRADGTDQCGVGADGLAHCMGYSYPGLVPVGPVLDVAPGDGCLCAVMADGTLACDGTIDPPPAGTYAEVDVGAYRACARTADGDVTCWGDMDDPALAGMASLSVGHGISCGLTSADGSVACWGTSGAVSATPLDAGYTDVAAGTGHACAIDAAGAAVCWGDDAYGQSSPPAGTFTAIGAGENVSCGVTDAGTIDCWGDESRLSDPPAGDGYVDVSPGHYSVCGLRESGRVVCWGTRGRPVP